MLGNVIDHISQKWIVIGSILSSILVIFPLCRDMEWHVEVVHSDLAKQITK